MSSDYSEFSRRVRDIGSFCFDVEHPPELSLYHPESFRLSGVSFATKSDSLYVTDIDQARKLLTYLWYETESEIIAYNAKYDIKCVL